MDDSVGGATKTGAPRWLVYALPPVLYAALLFLLSSLPSLPGPAPYGRDKVIHFVAYLGLAVLCARAFAGYGVSARRAAVLGLVAASAYGGSDELHQAFVPGRSSELADWLADFLGSSAGAALWFRLSGHRKG